METTLYVAITMADNDFDRLDKRADSIHRHVLDLIREAIRDGLWNEIGTICKATVTKIE